MTTTDDRPTTRTVADLRNPTPGWYRLAACQLTDPEEFAAKRGGNNDHALSFCATCPVTTDCLVDAVRHDDQWLIRAGMTPAQRNQWLKDHGIARAAYVPPDRDGHRLRVDMDRLIRLRATGATFLEIARVLRCTEKTAARRYAEWEKTQQAGRSA